MKLCIFYIQREPITGNIHTKSNLPSEKNCVEQYRKLPKNPRFLPIAQSTVFWPFHTIPLSAYFSTTIARARYIKFNNYSMIGIEFEFDIRICIRSFLSIAISRVRSAGVENKKVVCSHARLMVSVWPFVFCVTDIPIWIQSNEARGCFRPK